MSALPMRRKITEQEYLTLECQAFYRSEYVNGEVFAMAGASEQHSTIVFNSVTTLGVQLRGKTCCVYTADMRVRASASYVYPDVVVVCDERLFASEDRDTLLNPILILKVLSPSTEIGCSLPLREVYEGVDIA